MEIDQGDEPDPIILIIKDEPLDDEDEIEEEDLVQSIEIDHHHHHVPEIKTEQQDNDGKRSSQQKLAISLDCGLCSKTYKSMLGLSSHMTRVHHGSKKECHICGKVNPRGISHYHIKTHMNKEELHKRGLHHHVCYFCDAVFL
jgi:formate dehydrogenase assembly factor FdhD